MLFVSFPTASSAASWPMSSEAALKSVKKSLQNQPFKIVR